MGERWLLNVVGNMVSMFEGTDDFDQSLGSWDITKLTNATNMFHSSAISSTNYDNTIIGWATDNSENSDDEIDEARAILAESVAVVAAERDA